MSMAMMPGIMTPYSTVTPLVSEEPLWAPELERERIAAYQKYEEIYWTEDDAFRLEMRGTEEQPLYVPNPRQIVDTTAHFVMKGFEVHLPNESADNTFQKFLKREQFYTTFHEAKHSGVARGDYVFTIIADPRKPLSKRVSLISIDPGSWFPIWSEEDPDELLGTDLIDMFLDDDGQQRIMRQRYMYVMVGGRRRVTSELTVLRVQDWWDNKKAQPIQTLIPTKMLPERITTIPVYSFKNMSWQGWPYGASELKGYERLMGRINQSASDEDVSLALEGIGVYATTAPVPVDDNGNELDWVIAPGIVATIPDGTTFNRVQGVGSVKPFQDHLKYLEDRMFDASATFRPGNIDVQVAQSGIALAIKFLPTLAKTEQREQQTIAGLQQMFFDWGQWQAEYENEFLAEVEVDITLGEKLPKNKTDELNALNNALDRGAISKRYYREQIGVLYGYVFPEDIEEEILEEKRAQMELAQEFAPDPAAGPSDQSGTTNRDKKKPSNQSNNRSRPNESGGSEAK